MGRRKARGRGLEGKMEHPRRCGRSENSAEKRDGEEDSSRR